MKNEFKDDKINMSNEEENLNIDQISLSKNILNNKEQNFNDFEADLNLSEIILNDNNEIKPTKSSRNINQLENISIDKYFGADIDNLNKINITNRDMNESSIQNIELDLNANNNNEDKKTKKIITKDDLNNTPLPIFECLYCTNEKIVFQHFINEILSDKYLLQTSIYDISDLDKFICNKRITNKDDKNENLLKLVIKTTEYFKLYIPKIQSINYFKSNIYNNMCQKSQMNGSRLFKQKIEDSIVRKKKDFYFNGVNKIPKNSMNNKCLFNSTNSLINNFNALSGLVEPVQQINNNNNNIVKNNFTIASCSINSINFNSLSLNNNDFNCYCKDNNNMLDYIVEKIEKNDESVNYVDDKEEILDFFKFDLSRKINKKDLKWENKYYDIWNPDINSDFDENEKIYDSELIFRNNNYINNETKNKSINMNVNDKYISNNKNVNKLVGYIKYNIPKKSNLFFIFNKNKDKKNNKSKFNDINKDQINNTNFNNNNYSMDKNEDKDNSNINSINNNEKNISKEIDIKIYQNNINKSKTNININKSHDLSKFSNKCINNNLSNQKIILSGISNMKSFGSTTNSSYYVNKSANLVGRSRQKIKYKNKKDNNIITKSLQYISNLNNNSSSNYSVGVSINLKDNSSIKSNSIINCFNPGKISHFKFNDNKSLNKSKKKENKKAKKNNIFNIFNDINLLDLNHERAKSNYNLKKASKSTDNSNNIYKNKNKKNNFNIYKNNNINQQNIFNISKNKKRELENNYNNKVISKANGLLYSPNTIFNKYTKEGLYAKFLGLSFGSNEYNISENNTNVIFNSLSNLNKSKSNISNRINNNSPYKYKKSYYYNKNKKEVNNKINDLISLITNKRNSNACQKFYMNKNCHSYINDIKNKSINCFNSTSYLDIYKTKKNKNIYFNGQIIHNGNNIYVYMNK